VTGIRALAIVHQDDAGPGVFADAFKRADIGLDTWMISAGGDPPADPASYAAVAVFGGAMHADQEDLHPWIADEKALLAGLLEGGTPLLGVCLGSQLLASAAGAEVGRARMPEIGWHEVRLAPAGADDPVLGFLPEAFTAFGWHSYEATLPPGATPLAHSDICLQAYRAGESAWGIQFHAEVSPADLEHWTVNYEEDPDAVAIGLDAEALGRRNAQEIGRWNETGRALCGRFCKYVQSSGSAQSGVT
jgi:GMP synthase-like glutamine amidotransferase